MRLKSFLSGALFIGLAAPAAWAQTPGAMTPRQLQALPFAPADAKIPYGDDPNQYGELRLPSGPSAHPVVVLIHGGCFKAAYATLSDLAPLGDALKADGVATWNIEYRRLGQAGGGWPGTYQDVGRAVDHLKAIAPQYRLDLSRVVVVGHSAGGHLALWTAARAKLPADSPIAAKAPLRPAGVVDLAGPPDMRENIDNYQAGCGDPVIAQMLGGSLAAHPARYRQASPGAQLPLGVPQALFWGEHETFVPRGFAQAYVERAKMAGDDARLVVAPGAGHFEIAAPTTAAWPLLRKEIRRLLGLPDEAEAKSRQSASNGPQ